MTETSDAPTPEAIAAAGQLTKGERGACLSLAMAIRPDDPLGILGALMIQWAMLGAEDNPLPDIEPLWAP